ncbi:hypothetical protein BE24_13345 [Staphylococcus xylosus]|uniref:hypothetical protein n=1 Tax=Staphylococcus xylosus TaxID=1288 RepID=UPI00049B5847|nr:hypothetical protein [Staphylococcus xylosus]AID02915.1 hypothetical protein BE24_13345 [Staphylococcus xylosus]
MNYSEKVEKSVEFADLRNKLQSIIDYVSTETTELQDDREFAMQSNQPIVHQMINNNIKQNYVIESTLLAIRRDIEDMHDDIQTNIKQEKSASENFGERSDNA